jgi:hypothetical protein
MGCWGIGGPFRDRNGWMGFGDIEDEPVRAIHRGLDLGVTFFDIADVHAHCQGPRCAPRPSCSPFRDQFASLARPDGV